MKNTRLSATNIALATVLLFSASQAFGWGQIGHRVTGELAERYLSENAKAQVNSLFPNESLAEISTYADQERSNPSEFWQKTSTPWHYVTVPKGVEYDVKNAPPKGDAYTALRAFAATLKNPEATQDDKRLALHFIVHIIGDLHQPLHAGNGTDRGGNDVKVEFFWEESNLHRVWDSGLIDQQKLSYTEMSDWLGQKITPEMAQKWNEPDPNVWIAESVKLRDGLYPEKDKLSYSYRYQHLPTVKTRLQMAGVRIAAYLNKLFE